MQQQDERQQPYSSDNALYDRYASSIFAYARLHTNSWEDAEDLTLEVFLAALEHDNLSWLADVQQLVWLRRVAHNKLVDHYRRSPRLPMVPLEQVIETVRTEETLAPEQLVLRGEDPDIVREQTEAKVAEARNRLKERLESLLQTAQEKQF